MEDLKVLKQRKKELENEIKVLDSVAIQKYLLLAKELEEVKKKEWEAFIKHHEDFEKECASNDGHVWALLNSEFIPDHKSYTEFSCICIACGKSETKRARDFNNVIILNTPKHDDILMSSYVSSYLSNIYENLTNERKLSKQEAVSFINNNKQAIEEEFENYYSNKGKVKTKF